MCYYLNVNFQGQRVKVSVQHHASDSLYLWFEGFLLSRAQICYTCGGKNVDTPNTVQQVAA